MLMFALDPLTGKIDMDLIMTGQSSYLRNLIEEVKKFVIEEMNKNTSKSIPATSMVQTIRNTFKNIKEDLIKSALKDLLDEGRCSLNDGILSLESI